jgi:hypothetical protein
MVFPNGEKYVGQWENDKYHGRGILTLPDGSVYEGQFEEGQFIEP